MDVTRYLPGREPDQETVVSPTWADVEAAVRPMENYCYPIVELSTSDNENDDAKFVIIGGAGRWALSHNYGEWQYVDATSTDDSEVRLWESDQGYFCERKNVLTDIKNVLRIIRRYFDTSSYGDLDAVA
jgi:hypothetical protein